jgi:hypothetical protein
MLWGQSVDPLPQIGSVTVHAACAAVHSERMITAERLLLLCVHGSIDLVGTLEIRFQETEEVLKNPNLCLY